MESPGAAPAATLAMAESSYLPSQILFHTAAVWQERKAIACAFRTQVDFLLSHHMLLRSSYRLPIDLADCFCLDVPNEGPRRQDRDPVTKALIILTRQGQANRERRMEFGAAFRHRDPLACLVSALAFWLFWRWQIEDEEFPSFSQSSSWYDIKLLRQSKDSVTQQLSSQTANSWTRRLFDKCGIKMPKASRAPCVAKSQNTDSDGVVEASIRRHGSWDDDDQISECYLTSLPREAMRETADFDSDSAGSYYIPRSTVLPPAALRARVWPDLDKWKSKLDSGDLEQTNAVGAFIELLLWLRVVLLQDAPFLMAQYPTHPVFADGVFHSPEFSDFAAQVKDACQREKEDAQIGNIRNTMPSVAEQLRVLYDQRVQSDRMIKKSFETLSHSLEAMNHKLDQVARQMQSLQHFRVSFDLAPEGHRRPVQQFSPRGPSRDVAESGDNDEDLSGRLGSPIQPVAKAPPPSRTNDRPVQAIDRLVQANNQPPQYRLPRDTESIVDLLELWREGSVGMPSIDALEQRWGTRWRPPTEKSFYSTRKTIIDEVARRAMATGQSERTVAKQMDRERGTASLDKVMKVLRSQRKHQAASSAPAPPAAPRAGSSDSVAGT